MKYSKLAIQYMTNKHFWKLMLMLLAPSVVISLFTGFDTTAKLITFFPERQSYKFADMYSFTSEVNWKVLIGLVMLFFVYVILFAVMIGAMQRHMRTGKFALTNIFKRINENFLPVFITLLTVFVFLFLYGLCINVTIIAWWGMTKNLVATYVLTICFMVIFFLILMWLFTILFLTCPNMVVTGQSLSDSLSYSIRISRSKRRSLFVAIALPLSVMLALQFALVWIPDKVYRVLHVIINSIIMLVITCYYPVLMFVSYYDINDKDREDLLPVNRL